MILTTYFPAILPTRTDQMRLDMQKSPVLRRGKSTDDIEDVNDGELTPADFEAMCAITDVLTKSDSGARGEDLAAVSSKDDRNMDELSGAPKIAYQDSAGSFTAEDAAKMNEIADEM